MSRIRKPALLLALPLALLAVGGVFFYSRLSAPASQEAADKTEASPATAGEVKLEARQIEALGIQIASIQPAPYLPVGGLAAEAMPPLSASSQINLPYAGTVTRLRVDEGETIKPGQPLLQWQSQELIRLQAELARSRSEAGLARQQAARDALLADEGIIPAARKSESAARAAMAAASLGEANTLMSHLKSLAPPASE